MNSCRSIKMRRDNKLNLGKKVKGNFCDILFRRQTRIIMMPLGAGLAVRINLESHTEAGIKA